MLPGQAVLATRITILILALIAPAGVLLQAGSGTSHAQETAPAASPDTLKEAPKDTTQGVPPAAPALRPRRRVTLEEPSKAPAQEPAPTPPSESPSPSGQPAPTAPAAPGPPAAPASPPPSSPAPSPVTPSPGATPAAPPKAAPGTTAPTLELAPRQKAKGARSIKIEDLKAKPEEYTLPPTPIDTSIVLNLKKIEREPERRMSIQFSAGAGEAGIEESIDRARFMEEFARGTFCGSLIGSIENFCSDEPATAPKTAGRLRGDMRFKLNPLITLEVEVGRSEAQTFFAVPGFRFDERAEVLDISAGSLFTLPWRLWRFGFYAGGGVGYLKGKVLSQMYIPSFTGEPNFYLAEATGNSVQYNLKAGGEVFITRFFSVTLEGEYRNANIDDLTFTDETNSGSGLIVKTTQAVPSPIPGVPASEFVVVLDGNPLRGYQVDSCAPLILPDGEPSPDLEVCRLEETPNAFVGTSFGIVQNVPVIVPQTDTSRPIRVDFTGLTFMAGLRYHF